jgi:hypothetical protein
VKNAAICLGLEVVMPSRHIPAKIRRSIRENFAFRSGFKCGFPKCRKPAVNLHHTKRFALVKRHLEGEIVPLCKIHHELAHAGLIGNEDGDLSTWHIKRESEKFGAIAEIDRLTRNSRVRRKFQ